MRTTEPVKIIEVKGRNAGWLAAASALAKRSEQRRAAIRLAAGNPLLRGEIPAPRSAVAPGDRLLPRGRERDPPRREGPPGAPDARRASRTHGRLRPSAARRRGGVSVRAGEGEARRPRALGHARQHPADVQRARLGGGFERSARVRRVGGAVRAARRNRLHGRHAPEPRGKYRMEFGCAPLSKIANAEKKLPAEFFDRRAMLPTAAFRRYALPLVGAGLPDHARLRGRPVAAPEIVRACACNDDMTSTTKVREACGAPSFPIMRPRPVDEYGPTHSHQSCRRSDPSDVSRIE